MKLLYNALDNVPLILCLEVKFTCEYIVMADQFLILFSVLVHENSIAPRFVWNNQLSICLKW